LIVGRHVLGPGTLIVAGNRDEDPSRPTDRPAVLRAVPHLAGGRDAVAGGTWLAVRERRAVLAMLNRRGTEPAKDVTPRSRGLLALDLAAVGPDYVPRTLMRSMVSPGDALASAALHRVRDALDEARYAPFSAVFASPTSAWVFAHRGGARSPVIRSLKPGWHVITHANPDDMGEPRTASLLTGLRGWRPESLDDAERGLMERLSRHGDGTDASPPVCLHQGAMVTVSSFVVWLAPGEARYRHVEGRPCERALEDYTGTLAGEGVALASA
jgi:hypothetical protein